MHLLRTSLDCLWRYCGDWSLLVPVYFSSVRPCRIANLIRLARSVM